MYISKNWLKDFVFLPDSLTPQQLGEDMTVSIVEVEGVEDQAASLEGIVFGRVASCEAHPDADKLNVCQVDVGADAPVQVVCGGANVAADQYVALGRVGAWVRWHGEGDLVELKQTKIRGVASAGMICAASELGLADMYPPVDEADILDLSNVVEQPEKRIGEPLADVLGLDDVILDIDNKSMTHRPDLWGHVGMARELAAVYRKTLTLPSLPDIIVAGDKLHVSATVQDATLCPRYMAVAMDNVEAKESPLWLKQRLLAVGLRPKNVLVDVTNYVMYEYGQPLHCFDAARLETTQNNTKQQKIQSIDINVRAAAPGEKVELIDGSEHKLVGDMLVIADAEKPIAVAGVMGAANSEVSDATTRIVLESANFDPVSVRKTATALGVRSDAVARFEKSLDPHLAEMALQRAVQLLQELCPGACVTSEVVDVANFSVNQGPIEVTRAYIQEKMGVAITAKEIVGILERLGFVVQERKDILSVTVPTWRATKDIRIAADLVEEVARMYGYDTIPAQLPAFPITPPPENELRALQRRVLGVLVEEQHFTEVVNYSFVAPDWLERLGVTDRSLCIELENPIAKDRPLLRRRMIPNLLQSVADNLHRFDRVQICEIGRTYLLEEPGVRVRRSGSELLPKQDTWVAAAFSAKAEATPFFTVSHALTRIADLCGVSLELVARDAQHAMEHPGRVADIVCGEAVLGVVSELHPKIQQQADIDERVAYAELNLSALLPHVADRGGYEAPPTYPGVERDIAFVVKHNVQHRDVHNTIAAIDSLIRETVLFDVYEGEHVPEGKKSMAYRVVYRSDERTLTTKEVDEIHAKVEKAVKKQFEAELRE